MDRAKELFLKYNGNRFYMDHDGEGSEYDSYHVSRETEEKWAEEVISDYLESPKHGREAVRGYSAVTELLKRRKRDGVWDICLYYPLRADHLDDASVLFMLPNSFRLAERAKKKGGFSGADAAAYLLELNSCMSQVRERAESGILTRDPDYVMQEFSDPVYVNGYLDDIREKWRGLL